MSILYVVATPIGNLADFSLRAIDTLRNVDLIAAEDTRHSSILLQKYEITTPMVSYHEFNETTKGQSILERMVNEDISVAIITDAGTPCVSDPGAILIKMAIGRGIKVEAIPGASAIITALSISGYELDRFTFVGFFPRNKKEKEDMIDFIDRASDSLIVFYESPKRIVETLEYLCKYYADTELVVMNDLTKLHEASYRGTVTQITEQLKDNPNTEKGEYVAILGGREKKVVQQESYSLEAELIDVVSKNNCTLKEAVAIVTEKTKQPKKAVYDASLRLKNLL